MRLERLYSILFGLAWAVVGYAEIWRVTSLEWPPYASSTLEGGGSAVRLLRRVLADADIELHIEFYPWKRAQYLARSPEYIGYFPAWPQEVPDGFIASATVESSLLGVMYKEGQQISWSNLEELFSKYRVGLVSTYVYPLSVRKAAQAFPSNVVEATQERSLLFMLVGARTDVALTDPNVMFYFASKAGISTIKVHENLIGKLPLVLSIRNDELGEARVKLFNSALINYKNASGDVTK